MEVHREVTEGGHGLPGAEEVAKAGWIQVAFPTRPIDDTLERSCQRLGDGERGAILLAKGLAADLVLLDERKARRIAEDAGLPIIGCLGVLESAVRRGLVKDIRQTYMDLLHKGVRFDIRLLQDSLTRLGFRKL